MASCWIVAEAGVNWNGDRTKIVALIEAAKSAGASHIKFQAFSADALIERRGITDQNTIDLLRRCELTDDDLGMIQREAGRVGIPHFYSVFDPSQIERVLSRGACALKIGHAEAEYYELRDACYKAQTTAMRAKGVPTTHMALPVWISNCENGNVCGTWEYPATSPPKLERLWDSGRAIGFSSHYTDYRIPAAAALRGAEYVEAHLMLATRDERFSEDGHLVFSATNEPEAAWSLSPDDFANMVELIREYETWL